MLRGWGTGGVPGPSDPAVGLRACGESNAAQEGWGGGSWHGAMAKTISMLHLRGDLGQARGKSQRQLGCGKPPSGSSCLAGGQLFLAAPKPRHSTRIINPSQSSHRGRRPVRSCLSSPLFSPLLRGIFSCGPSWERAWPQLCGRGRRKSGAHLSSAIRPNNGLEGLENAPASRGWRRPRGPDWGELSESRSPRPPRGTHRG